ncbi:uncharacterized protein F4807DRAFT_241250 [Annulohypoxylon truncatum]|uniref:uncharacterized protein n=1 Tax=Annulohypoxylon truncatum TaxID=327061 RepID=UPI002008AC89|nr:uncharacterized protein F4807DRAFT_241250 [Annulohypoxylon truncatum]KAI1206213.1 hypothetical protein F4807DRAFT_241250 [Annulohypoxylon truncatum]
MLLDRDPSVQIGDRVIEAAAGNTDQGNELIQTLLNHNNGLSIGDNIVQAAAGNATTGQKVLKIIFQHAPNTKVSKAALEEAARNGNGRGLAVLLGRMNESEITDSLLEHLLEIAIYPVKNYESPIQTVSLILDRSNTDHPISDAVMKAAVRGRWAVDTSTKLLLKSGRPFTITEELLEVAALEATDDRVLGWLLEYEENLPVTENIVIAAIENKYTGELAMKCLLDRANINITKDMLKRAAELDGSYPYGWFRGEGKAPRQLTRFLLEYQDNLDVNEVFETAARNEIFEKFMFVDLLEWRENPEITEVVLVAAAQSTGEAMEAILEHKPDIQITQEVLKLVASNERWKMFSIMQIIFHYQRNIEITEGVMEAARNNKTMGRNLTALLRKHQESCTSSSSTRRRIR